MSDTPAAARGDAPTTSPTTLPDPSAPPPAPEEPAGPPPRKTLHFTGTNLKGNYQMFLSFAEAPKDPFIYYELQIPHINFFFTKEKAENFFEFKFYDQLAVGAGVKMSGFPSGGPITWSPLTKGQKATLTMQGHKMRITVEDDPDNPKAIDFTNKINSTYPQTLSLGFVNNNVFTTIFSEPQNTHLHYPDFVPNIRAYYTIPTEDLTNVKAVELWSGNLLEGKDTIVINITEGDNGTLKANVEG